MRFVCVSDDLHRRNKDHVPATSGQLAVVGDYAGLSHRIIPVAFASISPLPLGAVVTSLNKVLPISPFVDIIHERTSFGLTDLSIH